MEFFEVIEKRRAVRKYLPGKKIPIKDVNTILETVSLAPSARNLQSYKIFVAKTEDVINKIFQVYYNQRSDFIKNAALILIFCTDPVRAKEQFGERGEKLYSLQDATIAASFALLTATALGYASCWVGNFAEGEMQKILGTKLRPVASIIIGYADEYPERSPRKPLHSLAEFIS